MQIVITDHHLPGVKLPDADVIVNPSHPDEVFPDRSIAGVAVAWYVMAALRSELEQRNYFCKKLSPIWLNTWIWLRWALWLTVWL